MSKERRYEDHEVRQILDLAIGREDGPPQSLPTANGLTLVELQDVGREVGLPADRITQAVAAFEGRGEAATRGTTLGLPTYVARVVPLPRSPSDREWEILIAELRATFGGKGEVTARGSFREWSHSRVQALLEPTETGYRLRLTDANAGVGVIVLGGFALAIASALLAAILSSDGSASRLVFPAFFSLLGGSLIAGSAMSLRRWARQQEGRMEHIGRRALSLLARPASTDE